MPHLFSPLTIKNIELKNRIVVSPMCQYSSEDGFANTWHLVHQGSRAVGGAALIMTEATAVSPEGRITEADLGIWKDGHIDKLKEMTDFLHRQGSIAGIQLAHAGRKASHALPWKGGAQIPSGEKGGWKSWAPSALPWTPEEEAPLEMDKAGIGKVIADFKAAAGRALKAGYKVIELHAAHGYLLNEFLSPWSNKRRDEYGGSFDNRIRLLIEVIGAVRQAWPADRPLFVRISATEWAEGGWIIEESIALAKIMKEKDVDLVDCSSGGNIPGIKIPLKPGYQVGLSEQVRTAGILTSAVGLITESAHANAIIQEERADLVSLAREELRDPYFPLRAAHELGQAIIWPDQYLRAKWK